MIKREIKNRYKGSAIGLIWSLLVPLLMLGAYVFVFGVLFGVQLDDDTEGPLGYGLWFFTGLTAFWLFSESISVAPDLLLNNAVLIKKIRGCPR